MFNVKIQTFSSLHACIFISICFSLFAAPLDLKQSVSSNRIIVTAPLCHPPNFAYFFAEKIDKLQSRKQIPSLCRVVSRLSCSVSSIATKIKDGELIFCALESIFELLLWIFYFESSTSPRKSLSFFFRYCDLSPLLLLFDWRAVCGEERRASILRLQLVKTFLSN